MANWITFFSQSGSEIAELSNILHRKPDLIVTNNFAMEKYSDGMKKLLETTPMLMAKHDRLMDIMRANTGFLGKSPVVTLHGYLRILPADICQLYEIYNGHPGLITLYPELKGKDPQEKLITGIDKYMLMGSIVHKCTAELDGGDVIEVSDMKTPIEMREDPKFREIVYNMLRGSSLDAWSKFLVKKLK